MYGVSFDDGPTPESPALYDLLTANNQTATHFLIGTTILQNLDVFQQVVASGGHLAVHT
jgi:peptidoglycan/xylan/chitin deacetylase (PgdA/CDA1 family)